MYTRKPNCKCNICGKEIYRRPNQIRTGPVFCSSSCSNSRFKGILLSCKICGSNFKSRNSKAKTCSRACANINRRGINYKIGQPNSNFANGKVRKRELIRLRGPKCEICGFDDVVEILQVHHIIERCNGGSNEFTNLRLLCPNCHCTIHYYEKNKSLLPSSSVGLRAVG